jgi:menaquinone-dependent protoporphyrinogen oxidase
VQAGRSLVVAAASRHGSTCKIADRLASTLSEVLPAEWSVVRGDLSDLRTFDDADAVVLGSAIYFGHWMHSAARALQYVKDIPLFDLWLFSTGRISDVDSENAQVLSANAMVASGRAVEHHVFGGRLETSRLTWVERVAAKVGDALAGDPRDWDQVDFWAGHIAGQLTVAPARPGTPSAE